jgi:hypothetical protein
MFIYERRETQNTTLLFREIRKFHTTTVTGMKLTNAFFDHTKPVMRDDFHFH